MPISEDEAVRAIRAAVFAALSITLDHVSIVRPGTLPRTTSGKIRRAAASELWPKPALELAKAS